ncbi:hypothetical protein G7Z17_g2283 [Cylindrodendrum hubeiense]|uniref:Uncharacterized protein n=1 Tax=Cylindrodendrum hubeiense TaxID=595255 RepID=A0A9P5LEK9_9HYPO|nr:hypothetical protein G7Z17_g2283 [Cylindrodendrum hubeiense]
MAAALSGPFSPDLPVYYEEEQNTPRGHWAPSQPVDHRADPHNHQPAHHNPVNQPFIDTSYTSTAHQSQTLHHGAPGYDQQQHFGHSSTVQYAPSGHQQHMPYDSPKQPPSAVQSQRNLIVDTDRSAHRVAFKWRPGTLKSIPWVGLLALVLTLGCAVAIVGVLFSANGVATDSWPSEEHPIQVAVVLAVLIAMGNAGLTMAYGEGVTLTWWVKMLKGGNLNDSHRYWEHGASAFQSLLGIRHLSKITFVSMLLVLLLVDGPLLQRASSFTSVTETEFKTFTAPLSEDQLSQSTAYYMTRAQSVNSLTSNFSQVVQDFTSRTAIKIDLAGCTGTCSGTLIAAGFDVGCTRGSTDYDLKLDPGDTASIGSITVNTNGVSEAGVISVNTTYKAAAAEKGTLINTNCTLHSAKVKYPFTVINGTLTLGGLTSSVDAMVNRTIELLYPAREAAGLGKWPSLLGGIAYAADGIYGSDVELYQSGTLALQGSGPMGYTYMNSTDDALGTSNMTWTDPTPYILDAIREITFRAALAFSDASSEQSVEGTQLRTTTKYTLHTEYLAGTLAILVVGVIAVVWLFYGFWLLGRRVSMSPLEIAAAFQAPITAGADSNADATELASQVGKRPVKYGALHSQDGSQSLAIAPPTVVSWPTKSRTGHP